MKKVFVFSFLAIVGSLFFDSCALNAHVQKDASVNFNQFKTFAWSPNHTLATNSRFDNDIVKANVQKEVNTELASIGWVLNTEKPDVILDYNVSMQRVPHQNYSPYGASLGGMIPFGRRGLIYVAPSYSYNRGYTTMEKEGTLNLSMFRASDNKLIWQATVEGDLNKSILSDKDIHRYTKAAVKKLEVS